MKAHEAIWTPPTPLWPGAAVNGVAHPAAVTRAPSILRFATDNFMEDFLNTLATDPNRLRDYRFRRETWRGFAASPMAELPAPATADLRHPIRMALGMRARTTASVTTTPEAANVPLKLYQPAHLRHYVVTSSLVCDVLGLPDRQFAAGSDERATFVIRRLLPPTSTNPPPISTWAEHAWVRNVNGYAWKRIDDNARSISADEEDRLPLFAAPFDDHGTRRRLFAGVIPVGRRETYLGAPASSGDALPGVTSRTARKILFRKEVIEPWKALITRAAGVTQRWKKNPDVLGGGRDALPHEIVGQLKFEREHVQVISWLVLLDFAKFLSTYLKPVWRVILNPSLIGSISGYQRSLYDALEGARVSDELFNLVHRAGIDATSAEYYPQTDILRTMRAALAKYGSGAEGLNTTLETLLEGLTVPYDRADAASRSAWPDFTFPLADPLKAGPLPLVGSVNYSEDESDLALDQKGPVEPKSALDSALAQLDALAVVVVRALPNIDAATPEPAIPTAAIAPANALEGWFVIRFVYERPQCRPLHHEVVSDRTEPFQMAGFFDPDAPARPIRIGLPIDTTPAGLRKFDKNTAFIISDTLCGQLKRVRGLTLGDLIMSVLPWPFHQDLSVKEGGACEKGGVSLGMICSLSIPIITLCALILLIIMVTLFDFIFRWMPFFVFCFPLPGFKAKKT
jgi:hypothetical protein